MSDTYGSGLQFGVQGGAADAPPGLPQQPDAASPMPNDGPAPAMHPPAQPPDSGPSFGSSFKNMLPGPHYAAPDPQATALDQSASMLDQRIKRAGEVAANPLLQIFAPEQVQAARDFVPKATQELQQVKQQQQHAVDIKQTARNWNLSNPNQFGEQATDTTLANEALRQWKDEGNFNAYKALQGLSPEWANRANLYMPDAMAKFGNHVDAVQDGIRTLNGAASMNNEQAYAAAREQVIKNNDLASLGIKSDSIPKTRDEWMAKRGGLEAQYNGAKRTLNAFQAKQDQLNQATPVTDEKVAKQVEGTYQFGNGEAIPGFKAVSLPGYGDVQGVMGPPGSRDTTQRGVTWSNAAPEQIKTVREQLGAEEVKGALGKYKIAREFNETAKNDKLYKSAAGIALLSDELGAIGRDVAEGSKAAGTVGLTKMLEAKYGTIDNARNKLNTELAALQAWRKGVADNPRLSPPSIEGIKQVAQFKRDQALQEAQERIGQPLETAGRYGMLLKNLGIDKELTENPELRSVYDNALKQGNKELDSYPMVTIGDRRVMLPTGSNVPGAKVAPLPHDPAAQPQQNGATPPANPGQPTTGGVQQPPPQLSPQPNGGGQPIRVAGADVNVSLPPGASPAYAQSTQKIESGNEKDPWKAGTPNSSAGGAFQAIKGTWDQYKPPGAPDKAKDATPQQQADFFSNLTAANAATLKAGGYPVNDTSLYVAHNLGSGGASKLMSADPKADARSIVGEAAARNNPMFFRGRPTVAMVLQRYQDAMQGAHGGSENEPDDGPKPRPSAGGATAPYLNYRTGVRGTPEERQQRLEEAQRANAGGNQAVAGAAPAIGSTIGAIGGGILGGPPGAVAGGAVGGGAGQMAKDYLQGRDQNPQEILKQTALGGVLGVASEARPLAAVAARVAGAAGVEATDEALKGEDADPLAAGGKGLAYGLGGEMLGRFVSSAGATAYKALSRYTTSAQHELSASAGKLAEARQIMETEKPKLPGADGTETANPKYEAAKKQADDATAAIKDHGQNPDDMVHAYEQAKAGVSAGEAAVMRKAANEKTDVSQGYNQLRQDVRDTGVGTPKANQPVPNGPLSQLRTADNTTGKVPEQFRPEAEHAEMLIKAPAKDWGEKWQQLQSAGTELIEKRMAFLQNSDKPSAKAMDNLFEGVRDQQKAAANYVFGKEKGKEVIAHLETLDRRYAKLMNATQGMDYKKMQSVLAQGNTPERRELEKSFAEFAKGDPSAIRAFNAMKAGARGDWKTEAALMTPIIAAEVSGVVPTLGGVTAVVGGYRLYKLMQGYANAKTLGAVVTFKDYLTSHLKSTNAFHQAAGAAGNRAAVQGQPDLNPIGSANAMDVSGMPISKNIRDERTDVFDRKRDWSGSFVSPKERELKDALGEFIGLDPVPDEWFADAAYRRGVK